MHDTRKVYQNIFLILCCTFIFSYSLFSQNENEKSLLSKIKEWPIESYLFTDFRQNYILDNKNNQPKSFAYSEYKFQWDLAYYLGLTEWRIKNDFIYDAYLNKVRLDLREANIWIPTFSWLDLKVGRQILTWGKGDLVFINDLFPKDWQSFFIGREIEYLKAPSDALKLNINTKALQINFIYTPQFDPDRFLTGERISLSLQGTVYNLNSQLPTNTPNDFLKDAEYAIRFQKTIEKVDIALYGYHGYWKSPSGFEPTTKQFTFPSLSVYGLSLETNLIKGIVAAEFGHYISQDDKKGVNPLVRNSDIRYLISYSRDFKNDWNLGLQYYSEVTLQYDALLQSMPLSSTLPKKTLNQLSLRIGKMILKQKMNLKLISFYSFSGQDSYIRPHISYRFTDKFKADIGGNIFLSKSNQSFWGQFDTNDNIYAGLKYNF